LDELIREAWLIYERQSHNPAVVSPSIPILFFGDSRAYSASEIKVITVGLNPSRVEFPEGDRFCRFPSASGIYPQVMGGEYYGEYTEALNGYFSTNPYRSWFNSFEPLLNGLGASYYSGAPNTALHTDLCSPLATDPTWSRLTPAQREALRPEGTALWHRLVQTLLPDVIIISVAEGQLDNINFPRLGAWEIAHTVERDNPFRVKLVGLDLGAERRASLVFGRAANTPFGTVSNADKRRIGEALRGRVHGE
jgi:hypothetical protein